jgi:ribosomal protein L40E
MWRRQHDNAPGGSRGGDSSPGQGQRRGWRARLRPGGRRAWRMDPPGAAQVAWTAPSEHVSSEHGDRAASDVVPAQSPWPAEERLGYDMPSIYCTRCGQANPDDARFCLHCGTMLARPGADRPGETTSIISMGGDSAAEPEFGEDTFADPSLETLPPGVALLVVKRGPNAGSRFLLDSDITTAGRHRDSHIFLDDVTVSRRHAEFYRRGDRFTVRDVGSLNGTYVNQERIEEAALIGGDEVQIGKFRLVFLTGRRPQVERGGGGAQVGA